MSVNPVVMGIRITFHKSWFLLVFFLIVLISFPFAGNAQETVGIELEELTEENGWDCNNTRSSCINNDPNSDWYRSTASCTSRSNTTGQLLIRCTATTPDGSTSTSNTVLSGSDETRAGTELDASGEVVASSYESSSEGGGCSLNPSSWPTCLARGMAGVVLTFASFLLGVAGTLFNWVVVKTVFEFSLLVGNSPGLLIAWRILRDIGNMLLLFGFIFIGLATILEIQTYSAKRTLSQLIIFAILMNFSLFAAEAVIDTSNVLSTTFYEQANTDACFGESVTTDVRSGEEFKECAVNVGLAGAIMQKSGIYSIYQAGDGLSVLNIETPQILMMALFATVAAVVFFAAAIMLLVRAVTLTFLMVLAPIGFAGMAVPPLQKMAEGWWRQLINQAFFAPILILLILVSLKITESFADAAGRSSLAGALAQQNAGTMGSIMVYLFIIGFLIASLVAAKKFGAMGAGFAVKTASGITHSTMAWGGRQTAGRGFNALDRKVRNSSFGRTRVGRRVAGITNYGATSSFDFRGTAGAKLVGKHTGDLGKPHKGGYKDDVKKKGDAYASHAETLKQTGAEKREQERLEEQRELIKNNKKQEAQVWVGHEEELKNDIKDKRDTARTTQQARDRTLAEQSQKVAAASEAAAAAPTGDVVADSAARRELEEREAAERKAMDDMLEAHKAEAEREKTDIAAAQDMLTKARQAHTENMGSFDKEVEKINKSLEKVDKKAPQRQVAERLENVGMGSIITGSANARRVGVDKIKANLKKTKLQRDLEDIKKGVDSTKDKLPKGMGTKLDGIKDEIEKEGEEGS